MRSFIVPLCFFILLSASSADQAVLSSSETPQKLIFMMNFVRHGAHTFSKAMLYENEFESYGIPKEGFDEVTLMGKAQSYSYGSYLRNKYPDFFTEELLDEENSVRIVYPPLEKSFETAKAVKLGLLDEKPNWSLVGVDEEALEAVQYHGHCPGCPYSSYLDVGEIQELVEGEVEETRKTEGVTLVETENQWLVDTDALCSEFLDFVSSEEYTESLTELYESMITPGSQLEENYFKYLEGLYKAEKPNYLKINSFLFKLANIHDAHYLEELDLEDDLSALLTKENMIDASRFSFLELNFPNEMLASLHSSEMFKEIKEHSELIVSSSPKTKALFYVVHDNNLVSLLMGFLGREKFSESFVDLNPTFASALRIEFWSTSEGVTVQTYYKNKLLEVEGCGSRSCSLETFKELVSEKVVEDLMEKC